MLRLIVVHDVEKQPVYLLTNVLDPAELTDEEAADIYRQRWGIEVSVYRTIKQTMEFDALRSGLPENCYLELTWALMATWILQLMNVKALTQAGHDSREASPAKARNAVRRCLRNQRPCSHTRRCLATVLTRCCQDSYQRKRPKNSRNYPRKKHQRPPGPPKFKSPTEKQHETKTRLTPIMLGNQ
jgi:hypothetical protein